MPETGPIRVGPRTDPQINGLGSVVGDFWWSPVNMKVRIECCSWNIVSSESWEFKSA
jgi:hypothetical protein